MQQTALTYRLGDDPTIRKLTLDGRLSMEEVCTEFANRSVDIGMVYITSCELQDAVPKPDFDLPALVKQFASEDVRSGDLEKYHTADNNSRIIKPDESWAIIFTKKAGGFVVTCHHRGRPSWVYFWNNEQGWVRYEQ